MTVDSACEVFNPRLHSKLVYISRKEVTCRGRCSDGCASDSQTVSCR
jgi:hypothetical protein